MLLPYGLESQSVGSQESVDWLGDYLLSLTKSSVMAPCSIPFCTLHVSMSGSGNRMFSQVISHEPKFLNKICTDIISYKDFRCPPQR